MAGLLDEPRLRAFAMAYRMLGSVSDAEDVAQDALMRLHRVLEAGEEIDVPQAYLAATVVTRLGTDGSARRRCDATRTSAIGCRSRW